MRCNCNPSRAEFGDWRGVRRCSICGKVFHAGWKCRPKCEPLTEEEFPTQNPPAVKASPAEGPAPAMEDCPPDCEVLFEQDCQPPAAEEYPRHAQEEEDCAPEFDLPAGQECPAPAAEDFPTEYPEPIGEDCLPEWELPTHEEATREATTGQGEWTRVFPVQAAEENSGWPLSDLTDQLPPDPH